ncbi:MAG: TRAP transporter small permease [Alphaproteobacteria bacterium]|nr:TRAP transporter small permease [Alphaproteobacteria bacterium]
MIRALTALDRVIRGLALTAGGVLMVLAFYTVFAAMMRYLFNAPLEGVLDYSQMALVVVVFFAIAYCGRSGGHVAVDLFVNMLGQGLARRIEIVIKLLSSAVFAVLAWQSHRAALGAIEFLEATDTKNIPHAPFLWIIALGSLLYCLVLALEAAILVTSGSIPGIDAPRLSPKD